MTSDDINKPLGLPGGSRRRGWGLYLGAGTAAAVVAAAAAAWLLLPGEHGPTATAVVNNPPPGAAASVSSGGVSPDTTGSTTAASTDGGLSEVVPDGDLANVGTVVIHDPSDPTPIVLASLPREDLIQRTADGLLPRIAPDGTRPLDAYARPANANAKNLRIAIVIGGFGIDPDATTKAIATLPGAVTLAFAPYGDSLPKLVSEARAAGHELLLQIPLEPYNYPQTNPGPNTLTADATAAENLDRLHWLLGRITNYVGVINYMGARFTDSTKAMDPVLTDIGARGLLYLDDGSSARSKAAEIAGGGVPFLHGDVILDADLQADAIDARLDQLKAIARERGYAIATATAFPVTIDRVTAFVKAAAGKGIDIVPVSALVGSP